MYFPSYGLQKASSNKSLKGTFQTSPAKATWKGDQTLMKS